SSGVRDSINDNGHDVVALAETREIENLLLDPLARRRVRATDDDQEFRSSEALKNAARQVLTGDQFVLVTKHRPQRTLVVFQSRFDQPQYARQHEPLEPGLYLPC